MDLKYLYFSSQDDVQVEVELYILCRVEGLIKMVLLQILFKHNSYSMLTPIFFLIYNLEAMFQFIGLNNKLMEV
jgi:hypothetical protein